VQHRGNEIDAIPVYSYDKRGAQPLTSAAADE
jgi:hypothetical protein